MPLAIEALHPGNLPLTNISVRYTSPEHIGEMIFPTVVVQKLSDRYYVFDKSNLRLEETVKGDKSEANKGNYGISTGNYQIIPHSFEMLVTPGDIANADTAFSPMQDATEYCTDVIKTRLEYDIATNVMASSTYASTMQSTTGLPYWNNSSGQVVSAVTSAKLKVAEQIGKLANTVVMDPYTLQGLRGNTTIRDQIKYTSGESISTELLARLFEIDRVLVGNATRNSAVESITRSDSMGFMWSTGCAVLYVEPNPGLRKPTFGYMFRTNSGRVVETRDATNIATGAKYVRVNDAFDDKVIDTSAGFLLRKTYR